MSRCRYGIDFVNGTDILVFLSCSTLTASIGSEFSEFLAGSLMYASSPVSYEDFRGGGVRVALSEVLFMENCEPCDLDVFGDEDESGLLLCVCIGGSVVTLSEPVGE